MFPRRLLRALKKLPAMTKDYRRETVAFNGGNVAPALNARNTAMSGYGRAAKSSSKGTPMRDQIASERGYGRVFYSRMQYSKDRIEYPRIPRRICSAVPLIASNQRV